jgi:hypothetical protein
MISLSPKLQLAIKGREISYLYKNGWSSQGGGRMASLRRAHQVLKMKLPSVGEWATTSPHSFTNVQTKIKGRRVRHLLGVWAATSRVRHLSKRGAPLNTHVPISIKIWNQSIANQPYLVSFDSFLTFSI